MYDMTCSPTTTQYFSSEYYEVGILIATHLSTQDGWEAELA